MEFSHQPIMLNECIEALNIKQDGIYVDCTIGGGGHSKQILKKLTDGKLIGIDKDDDALQYCREILKEYNNNLILVKSDYNRIEEILNELNIDKVDGILMDLGVSSYQLDNAERGFSYRYDSKLDMRMNQTQQLSAYEVVNNYSAEDLKRIIKDYGEEKFAVNIVKNIVFSRTEKNIETTKELVDIIDKSIPQAFKRNGHPAKKTFQAIRIEVNGELIQLSNTITNAVKKLKQNGRIAIITFHSLEDRIVKQTFRDLEKDCICPPDSPICTCNKVSEIKILTPKPILPSNEELIENSRACSAKLRIAQRK